MQALKKHLEHVRFMCDKAFHIVKEEQEVVLFLLAKILVLRILEIVWQLVVEEVDDELEY